VRKEIAKQAVETNLQGWTSANFVEISDCALQQCQTHAPAKLRPGMFTIIACVAVIGVGYWTDRLSGKEMVGFDDASAERCFRSPIMLGTVVDRVH
jgi:hypothetical protein